MPSGGPVTSTSTAPQKQFPVCFITHVSLQTIEGWSGQFAPGEQHRYPLPVAAILVAEHVDEIALFQQDADEDVGGGHRREQQMSGAHERCRPERDDEAEIDRVSYEIIEERRPEDRGRHLLAREIVGDLMQSKQLEMID